ncbi:MAG: tetratricopeptide repeat protein [Desulfobacteraceae bacterium]
MHKEPDPNALLKARMEEEREKASQAAEKPEKNFVLLARELMAKGHYEVALVQLKDAKKEHGRTPEVEHLTGICYRETDEPGKAEDHFRRALSLDSEYAPAHDGLGLVYARTGRGEEARDAFTKAIRYNPARPDFLNNLGFLEMQAGHLGQAETHFKKSLRLAPEFHPALNNLAVCYGLQGREKEAFSLLKAHYPPAEALNNMGVILRLRGEDQRAALLFERALKADPGLEAARDNLARLNEVEHTPKTGSEKALKP